jgi:Tol biopolymer transport system component
MLGQGWIAEDWLTLLQAEGSPYAARPELADAGLIAFVRNGGAEAGGVWLMKADGTSPRLIYPVEANQSAVSALRWSPDGELIAVGVSTWVEQYSVVTRIIDVTGTVVAEYPGLAEAAWSPDGGRLSALRLGQAGEFGGYDATPVVFDVSTGTETAVGPTGYYVHAPEWAPDGSAVAMICRSRSWREQLPDGTVVDRVFDCEGDGLRAVSLADSSVRVIVPIDASDSALYLNPSWSPDGQRIVLFAYGGDCEGYSVFDVASGTRASCLEVPGNTVGGGCGISTEAGASDWTPDGRTLAYHWQSISGQNGVALVDIATGERRMILTTGSSSITFSSDGTHLSYESAGYVWTADTDASDVSRVTDGWLPAWQPRP